MSNAKPASRRRHDADLRPIFAICATAGASVAQVAMTYGLNANLVPCICRCQQWHGRRVTNGAPSS